MRESVDRCGIELIAWVVMPEHVHLLVAPPVAGQVDIGSLLKRIKQSHATKVITHWRRHNATIHERIHESNGRVRYWQPGGGFDRNVRDHEELLAVVDYIHANPVKRGLVARKSDWRWSSVHQHLFEPIQARDD